MSEFHRMLDGGVLGVLTTVTSLWVVDPARCLSKTFPEGGWLALGSAFAGGVIVVRLFAPSEKE